jgi:methyl-accepting chemotaxis protein
MKAGWTIGKKLILSFLAVAAVTLILGVVGYYGISKQDQAIHEVAKVRLPSVDSLLIIDESAQNIKGTLRTLGISGLAPEVRQRQYDNLKKTRKKYEAAWAVYEPLPQTAEEAKVWQQFVPAWNTWRDENNKFIKMAREFDQNGIADPKELVRQIERFTKDHYILVQHVNHLLHQNEGFDGGEDHTVCNAGQWLPEFQTDNQEFQDLIRNFEAPHKQFHDAVKAIKNAVEADAIDEANSLYQKEMIPSMNEVFGAFDQMLALANESMALMDKAQAQMLGPVMDAQQTAMGLLDQLVEINRKVALQEVNSVGYLKTVSLIGILLGVGLALTLGLLVSRGINKSLSRIVNGMSAGAEQVSSASTQVASSSQSQAEGANQQASSLEETSSSLEEISAQTNQNANNAEQADRAMKEAAKAVEGGVTSMERMSSAINEIKASSAETSKIIKTIDEIAFQTNLLALNAAVEAARAGEAGKGFAVVAEEVRNLAQRSAEAAQNTSDLIEKSQENAEHGVSVTEEASTQLKSIQESSEKVNTLISEITVASKEQAQGIEQVNTGVSQMDKVVQQNAADAEESASAAEELSSQAQEMEKMVAELEAMVGASRGNGWKQSQKTKVRFYDQDQGQTRPKSHSQVQNQGQTRALKKAEAKKNDQVIPLDDEEFKDF